MSSPHPTAVPVPQPAQTAAPAAGSSTTPGVQPPGQANTNYVSLCRLGQDTVQDIVQKTNEMFQVLKTLQLPNETTMTPQTFSDRKTKLEEYSKIIVNKFKTLHVIYDKVNEYTVTLDSTTEIPPQTESQLEAVEEHRDTVEQVRMKNAQLKEIIDHLRTVIWEVNTMIAMRKTVVT